MTSECACMCSMEVRHASENYTLAFERELWACTESSRLIACSRKTISLRHHTVDEWQIKMHATKSVDRHGNDFIFLLYASKFKDENLSLWSFARQHIQLHSGAAGRKGPGEVRLVSLVQKQRQAPEYFLQQELGNGWKWIISDQYRSSLLECKGHAGHVLRILYKGCRQKAGPAALRRHHAFVSFVMLHNDTHTASYRIIQNHTTQVGVLTHLDLEQYGAMQTMLVDHDSQVPDSEAMVADSACLGWSGYLRLVGSKQRSRHSVVGFNQIPHRFCQNCKKYQSRRSTMIYPQDVILFGRITFNWRVRGNAWQCIAKLPRSICRWDWNYSFLFSQGIDLCSAAYAVRTWISWSWTSGCTHQASGIHNDILSLSHVHLFDPAVSSLSFYVLLNKASSRQDVM